MSNIHNKERIEYIDLAKGFCILLVVWGHSMGPLGNPDYFLRDAMSMFRMPLYFFLSGLFFKTYEGFTGFVKRKVNKLVIPFLFWHVLFVLSVPFVSKTTVFDWSLLWTFALPGGDPHNTSLWFLCCLFLQNIIFYLLISICRPISTRWIKIMTISLLVVIAGCFGFYCSIHNLHYPLKFETVLSAMPFFAIGYVCGQNKKWLRENRFDKWNIIGSLVCLLATVLISKGEVVYRFNSHCQDNILELYGGGLLGIMFILLLSKKVGYIPIISYLGRYSIMILVTHLPVVWWVSYFISRMGCHWLMTACISTTVVSLSYLALIPLFKRYLPYVTAQKEVIKINELGS